MRTTGTWISMMGLLALPSVAAAQDLPTNPPSGYFNEVAANPKGTVDNITYGSSYVARVYTPPGYSTSQRYPVMYLMHGMGGSERSWHDNDLYAHIQLDNLIALGAVDPFIMVFTRNDYANWSGFGDILIDELIPFVEENYSVCANADNRALGGLSMGGMQTINFGFPNADKFHYLMPSSSAPGIQGESQLFPNGGELARTNLKLVFFSAGENEIGAYGEQNNTRVMGYCENAGISSDIIFEYFAPGGGHDRNTWRPSFWNYAQLAHRAGFTNVATTCGGGTGGMAGAAGSGMGGVGMGGMAGAAGSGMGGVGMGGMTGGADAGGASGGSSVMGGRAGNGDGAGGAGSGTGGTASGAGGAASGAGGVSAQGGTPGTSGAGVTGGAPATGGSMPAAGGTGGTTPTTGGQPTTGGATAGVVEASPAEDGGCACSLPGSTSKASPFALLGAALAVVLGRTRRQRWNLRG